MMGMENFLHFPLFCIAIETKEPHYAKNPIFVNKVELEV